MRRAIAITTRWLWSLALLLALVGMAIPTVAQPCEWAGGFQPPGMNAQVWAPTVFDDGTGLVLYAGGRFGRAGGVAANLIAKWDGTQWSALGSGVSNDVYALTMFDDGTGAALYAGGFFTTAGGRPSSFIAAWRCAMP